MEGGREGGRWAYNEVLWVNRAHPCSGGWHGEGRVNAGEVELERTVVTLHQVNMASAPNGRRGGEGRGGEEGRGGGEEGGRGGGNND